MHLAVKLLLCVAICNANNVPVPLSDLHTGITQRIGNFSLEFLYQTSTSLDAGQNFIMSPITIWSTLALIAEGASFDTRTEIVQAIHLPGKNREAVRQGFQNITQWLQVNTSTVELSKFNRIFVDAERLPLPKFIEIASTYYETNVVTMDFRNAINTSDAVNQAISKATHGKISKLVDPDYFQERQMILTSALYFKGGWTSPFNKSSTSQMPFYDSKGQKIGDVNMMYNRYTYPFANIRELQARVTELPYGIENRLSMLVMLPHSGVSVEDMFLNFQRVNLDRVFEELRQAKEEYAEDEVDCYIPRFKIESDLDITDVLKEKMAIVRLFDESAATLPNLSPTPLYVTKVVHKAQIEVTEEGTEAAAVTVAEFSNRIGTVQFLANRPFTYMIVEKVTNSIVFAGFYKTPSLF